MDNPTQFLRFEIRYTTFANNIEFADLLILRLLNCESKKTQKKIVFR